MNLMGFLHIVVCLCYILKNYIILTTQFLFSTQLFEIKTVQPDEQEKLVTNLSLFSSCFFFFLNSHLVSQLSMAYSQTGSHKCRQSYGGCEPDYQHFRAAESFKLV